MADGTIWKTIAVMLVAVAATTLGDILMGKGEKQVGGFKTGSVKELWGSIKAVISSGTVWMAIFCMAAFFFLWMAVLSWADLSLALPMTALTYVFNAILAKPMLGEHVSPLRWAGTLVIFVGVVLVTLSA